MSFLNILVIILIADFISEVHFSANIMIMGYFTVVHFNFSKPPIQFW